MRRIIWKEFRERAYWMLLLAAATVAPVLWGTGYTFVGSFFAFSIWVWPSFVAAFLLGAGSFTSELSGGADFVFSRPVSWKKVITGKTISGLTAVAVSVLLAAGVYLLLMPVQYRPVLSLASLAPGIGLGLLFQTASYLCGMTCSVVLPGMLGGLVILVGWCIPFAFQGAVLSLACRGTVNPGWPLWLWAAGAVAATVLIARFGLTLDTSSRAARYALVVMIAGSVSTAVTICDHEVLHMDARPGIPMTSVSPDGRYVLVWSERAGSNVPARLRRLSDGKTVLTAAPDTLLGDEGVQWTSDDSYVYYSNGSVHKSGLSPDGKPVQKSVRVGGGERVSVLLSPMGTFAMVSTRGDRRTTRKFVDIDRMRVTGPIIVGSGRAIWWQSDAEVGCIDSKGVRHIIKVAE